MPRKNTHKGQRQFLTHSFGPFCCPDSEILILGSFPSAKSRETNFYYGHPRNRFWKVLAALCLEDLPENLDEKKDFLRRNRIALYDVIDSCSIIGSADSTIEDVTVTDLRPLLDNSRIGSHIYTNGGKAYQLYHRYIYPDIQVPAVKLPSTSPANAAWSLERLVKTWGEAIDLL